MGLAVILVPVLDLIVRQFWLRTCCVTSPPRRAQTRRASSETTNPQGKQKTEEQQEYCHFQNTDRIKTGDESVSIPCLLIPLRFTHHECWGRGRVVGHGVLAGGSRLNAHCC